MLWRTVLVFTGCFLAAETASACSCVKLNRGQVIEQSEVAFTGTARSTGVTRDGRLMVAVVNVTERIKSRIPKRVSVVTINEPSLCGYPMQVGRNYGFAGRFEKRDRIDVSMCTMVPMNPDH
jgi:hypothetical protein